MNRKYAVTGIVIAGIMVGGILSYQRFSGPARPAAVGNKIKGNPNGPVQIVEFGDFQCPACRYGDQATRDILKLYPDRVGVRFAHYPLKGHRHSRQAHITAECAHRQGKYWAFHDKIFDEQDKWAKTADPSKLFAEYAKESGLDLERLKGCLSDPAVEKAVMQERDEGQAARVQRTPTFFVNGERIVGAHKLKETVEKVLGIEPVLPPPPAETPAPAIPDETSTPIPAAKSPSAENPAPPETEPPGTEAPAAQVESTGPPA